MSTSETRPVHNTKNIDFLRASAAMIVVISHLESIDGISFGWLGIQGGWVGVQLFFVISGYLIIQSAFKYSAKEYFIHRFFRIFPAYLFWYIAFGLIGGKLMASAWADPYFYANLTLLHHFIPEAYLRYTFINPSWTLSVEWGWYIVAFLLALTHRKWMLFWIIALTVVATWWVAGGFTLHPLYTKLTAEPVYVYFFLNNNLIGQLPFFLFGSAIYFYRPKLPMLLVAAVSITILVTFNLWVDNFPNPIFFTGIAIGGIFWCFVNMKWSFHGRVVKFISDTSYSIYLVHYPIIAMVSEHVHNKYHKGLVALLIVFPVAYMSYRFIEKPAMPYGRRLASRPAQTNSATA